MSINKERLDKLIERAVYYRVILNETDPIYGEADNLKEAEVMKVEKELDLRLSNEFKYINYRYAYEDIFAYYEFLYFPDQVIEQAKFWREHKDFPMPHKYIELSNDGTTMVILETRDDPEEPSVVWDIAFDDIGYFFANGVPSDDDYIRFEGFDAFFEYLIEQGLNWIEEDLNDIEDPMKRKKVEEMLAKARKM